MTSLRHFTRDSDHRTVDIDLGLSMTMKRRDLTDPEDPGVDAEAARETIHKALQEYGGEGHALLVALGWKEVCSND